MFEKQFFMGNNRNDKKTNKSIVHVAKTLRKNMTKEERRLWYDFLKNHDRRFSRQKVLGKYIVDFYCASAKLVVEIDGSGHYSDKGIIHDAERTAFLAEYGLKVVRIPNTEINANFFGVCEYIDYEIKQSLSQQG